MYEATRKVQLNSKEVLHKPPEYTGLLGGQLSSTHKAISASISFSLSSPLFAPPAATTAPGPGAPPGSPGGAPGGGGGGGMAGAAMARILQSGPVPLAASEADFPLLSGAQLSAQYNFRSFFRFLAEDRASLS